MMNWQPIETYIEPDKRPAPSVILWNGKYVFAGYLMDKGWYDEEDMDAWFPVNPQPTHWINWPEPPLDNSTP